MSGIVGIVNFDGAPIDRDLLARMTAFMDFRGPDASQTWIGGFANNVGFGHTLLRTTFEAEHESQPFTFDGKNYIVADCRVDAREELISKLRAKGRDASLQRPDVENILHAWHVWGEDCVHHLLGDFAFAIWDAPNRKLFCARDHMGVKPFYHAHIGQTLIFSNTLDCVRKHPAVSAELNDLAIADFLLFELNQDPATTSFADIQRIPAAHRIACSAGQMTSDRYWTLPIDEPLHFERLHDYTDGFKSLLDAAVGDRLRYRGVGIFMSGGIDSPTLAASACGLIGNDRVRAFTSFYEGYDDERHYAGLVAAKLGIRIQYQGWRDEMVNPDWESLHSPEPEPYPNWTGYGRKQNARIAVQNRIVFLGEGPDVALRYEWNSYLRHQLNAKRFGRVAADLALRAAVQPEFPMLRFFRTRRHQQSNEGGENGMVRSLNSDLRDRLDLRARSAGVDQYPTRNHPTRPLAYANLQSPVWERLFASWDSARTQAALEIRHPFIDLRLMRFMLRVPVMPWCRKKYLMRRSMIGLLPPDVLKRPKSPLLRDPWVERVVELGLPEPHLAKELARYIESGTLATASDSADFWSTFRIHALNHWLSNRDSQSQIFHKENMHEFTESAFV